MKPELMTAAYGIRPFWFWAAALLLWTGNLCAGDAFELKISVGPWLPYTAGPGDDHTRGPNDDHTTGPSDAVTLFESKIKNLFEKNGGFKVTYLRYTDWDKAISAVGNGIAYISLPWGYNKERGAQFQFSVQPVLVDHEVLFTTTQKAPKLATFFGGDQQGFNQFRIARIKPYIVWNHDLLKKKHFNNIVDYSSTMEAFLALQEGHVDFVSENLFVGYTTVMGSLNLDPCKHTFFPTYFQAAFPPDDRQLYIIAKKKQFADPILQRIEILLQTSPSDLPLESSDVHDYRRVEPMLPEVVKIIAVPLPQGANGGAIYELDAEGVPGTQEIPLPLGTKAVSIAWTPDLRSLNAQIINGPFRGKVVRIPIQQLEIGERLDLSFMKHTRLREKESP